jgi:MFS family permease
VARLLTAVEPLIPISMLADPAARLAILANCFGWGSIVGLNIFLPMYLQTVLGWSATDSGLSLIILMVTLNASAGLSSPVIGRVRHYKALPMACMVLAIGAVVALGLSVSAVTPLKFQVILFLIGIGFGPTAPLTQVALQNTVAARHLGTAVGAMNFGRTLMGTVLVAVFGTIVLAGVPAHGVGDGARVLSATSASTFAIVFFAMAATMSVALLAVIRLEEKPLLTTMPSARM